MISMSFLSEVQVTMVCIVDTTNNDQLREYPTISMVGNQQGVLFSFDINAY